ncbi:LysR family transcriptional regulator [Aquitalea sp. LB_tupeE]|uniref:LysR family transcriptional regulator n=1 Tax=Aquitalea sp. LB_tupeE TaxID=2748078 RepID=UPI0015B7B324|nr:LysR family transcriptional regulator [Aquitalea sp. LB_tupeE]NWK79853.1 LysR family transcriptional regulator [Aquitalea sp. LB_tupeE]
MARINLELNELQAFLAVAEKSSFKAAAEALYLSQPALSRRIEKLEQSLQVRLLERTTRSVRLTEEGAHFLLHAQNVVDELEQAMSGLSERAERRSGVVSIASIPSVAQHLLPAALAALTASYPALCLRVFDEGAQEVLEQVLAGHADFGINLIGAEDPNIDFEPLLTEHYLAVVRHDHPLATQRRLNWEDLVGERLIGVSQRSGNRLLLDHHLASLPQRPRIHYEASHLQGAYGMAEAGLGVLVVPELSLTPAYRHQLVGIALGKPAVSRTLGLITRSGYQPGPAAEQLRTLLRAQFAQYRARQAAD